jgi:hypothetical protein
MKHNKKRNTAFLYESLVKELTKAVVRKQDQRKQKIIKIIKENFQKGTLINEELTLYKSILENKDKMTKEFTERFLVETRKDYDSLDRKAVFNYQFNNFVPNYKDIATVGAWFQNNKANAKTRLIVETKVKSLLVPSEVGVKEMKHIDNLTYKTFVNKFNETYKNSLKENQKNLLTNYITSFSDNGLGLKVFVNEEVGQLKEKFAILLSENKDIAEDRVAKITKVAKVLEEFSNKPLSENMIKKLFFIQDLAEEL